MQKLKEKQRKSENLMTGEDDDDDLFDRDPSFDSNKAMQSSWKQNQKQQYGYENTGINLFGETIKSSEPK